MHRLPKIFFGLFLIHTLAACESKKAVAPEKEPVKEAWADQMQGLANVLGDLIPMVSSTRAFNDPKNTKRIDGDVDSLLNLSHKLGEKGAAPDKDPSLQIISGNFKEDIQRAKEAMAEGHRDYAQFMLKNSTAYCIQCHTRNSAGPNFVSLKVDSAISSLPVEERADFYAATRQFDKALQSFQDVIKTSKKFSDWDRAARVSLAISVRYLNDPAKAEEIIDLILKSPNAPLYLRDEAELWKKSIPDWKKDLARKQPVNLASAEALMTKGQKLQRYPMDHATDLYFLRASAKAHSALEKGLKGEDKARALWLAGQSYEYLRIPSLWNLNDQYYEACIRAAPHTPAAQKCFKSYESSQLMGFLGSDSFDIPWDAQSKLIELRSLAF